MLFLPECFSFIGANQKEVGTPRHPGLSTPLPSRPYLSHPKPDLWPAGLVPCQPHPPLPNAPCQSS